MAQYGYMLGTITGFASGTGTVTISGGGVSVALVGTGTSFTTELAVGSIIVCSSQTWSVASITDNTHLTLNLPATSAVTGGSFTYKNLTNVEALNTTDARLYPPKSTYRPYVDGVNLANGRVRGFGRPIASWKWGYIPLHFRTALRAFCATKSEDVYIRTRTNEADAYEVYSAVMIWPDDEEKDAGRRINFTLEFRNLIAL